MGQNEWLPPKSMSLFSGTQRCYKYRYDTKMRGTRQRRGQRLEQCSQKPRHVTATRSYLRLRKRHKVVYPIPSLLRDHSPINNLDFRFQASRNMRKCGGFQPLSLWWFVTAATGSGYNEEELTGEGAHALLHMWDSLIRELWLSALCQQSHSNFPSLVLK